MWNLIYIERQISDKFEKISKAYPVVALVGARQAGKTTFLKKHLHGAAYVLFDDPDARELFEEDIKKFETQYVKQLTVLDEVHYCKDAGRKLKYLADKGNRLWITSSSELILKKEVLSYLVGRVSILRLYPFSLQEFLKAKQWRSLNEKILKRAVWEHMVYGGYPKAVLTEDTELKETILKDLYETMILKDIARTFSIDDIDSLEKFTRYLAINTSSIITYNKIADVINISHQTIKKYLDAMEKSHLLVRVQPFYSNKNKEITKQPKVYFLDTGLRNAVVNSFRTEAEGMLFENYVLTELIKNGWEVKFWRNKSKAEVDFIVEVKGEIIPVEVKLSSTKISRSLQAFIKMYSPKRCFVVNYEGKKRTVGYEDTKIEFLDIKTLLDRV
ncbi:MAG: ATP-binding protein [Bacteroidales bacterium]|nr:ATP-binding protein [Bacteroidales bacterium]